jgi:hypothetical protein
MVSMNVLPAGIGAAILFVCWFAEDRNWKWSVGDQELISQIRGKRLIVFNLLTAIRAEGRVRVGSGVEVGDGG